MLATVLIRSILGIWIHNYKCLRLNVLNVYSNLQTNVSHYNVLTRILMTRNCSSCLLIFIKLLRTKIMFIRKINTVSVYTHWDGVNKIAIFRIFSFRVLVIGFHVYKQRKIETSLFENLK